MALLAIRNSFHLGRIGHWAEQCARGGFASIHFVNVHRSSAAAGALRRRRGAVQHQPVLRGAARGPTAPAVVLDMATSKIAIGKARVAANQGVPVPADSLLDAAGRPTRDRLA